MATEPLVESFLGIIEYTANSRPFSVEHICGGVAMMTGMGIRFLVFRAISGDVALLVDFSHVFGREKRGARLQSVIFEKSFSGKYLIISKSFLSVSN